MRLLLSLVFLLNIQTLHALKIKDVKVELESFDDYSLCHERRINASYCQEGLKYWLKDHPQDIYKAAKAVRKNMNSFVAVSYFHKAQDHESFDCNDKDLYYALQSAFNLSPSEKETLQKTLDLAFKKCGSVLPQKLVSDLSASNANFTILCKDFINAGLLKGLKARKCK